MSPTTSHADAATHLAHDPRAARMLAAAEQNRAATLAQIEAADAAAARELHLAEQRQRLAAQARTDRLRTADEARARRDARRDTRRQRRAAVLQRVSTTARYARTHGDAVYAAGIYALAVGGAVYGQVTAATSRGWPLPVGIVIAAAIEGLALVMALTAQRLRLHGEAARTPRALTWACAGLAAGINYAGHAHTTRTGAALLAVLSAAGIVVWEIRSGAKHRAELRARQLLPDPPATFGWRRWLRYPRSTAAAWSLDIRDRVSPRSRHLLDLAETERTERGLAGDRAAVQAEVRRLARRAVRAAVRRGDTGAALTSLTWLAQHGSPRPVRPLPADRDPADRGNGPATGAPSPAAAVAAAGRDLTAPRSAACVTSGMSGSDPDRTPQPPHQPDQSADEVDHAPLDLPGGQPDQYGPPAGPKAATSDRPSDGMRTVPPVDRPHGRRRRAADLDVSDLLPVGRQIRDELAEHGIAVSRAALSSRLRDAGVPIATNRAGALLAILNAEPPGGPAT
ncbi:DUF2637 domain-containing protein [Dactylosporangium sp. NPDC000521]|uniref:DUF2637 domain-containing protein n=1 Tax=Dactylosporangium sp. NPDC000521 TaxID=3363975 RepID=UPI0036A34066